MYRIILVSVPLDGPQGPIKHSRVGSFGRHHLIVEIDKLQVLAGFHMPKRIKPGLQEKAVSPFDQEGRTVK